MQDSDKVIYFFDIGQNAEIRSVLQAFRDNNRAASYLQLIQHVQYEGDAIRARNDTGETISNSPPVVRPAGDKTRREMPADVLK